ncbi:ferritin-like domain-containing protein [Amylocystis lapponica]|nr:ferritin-like domain-containing protein [Amylocystis lapponica]
MLSTTLLLAVAAASAVLAAPTPQDVSVLQFALTLEHLESAFYSSALAQFDDLAFALAGYAPWVRGRFEQINKHEMEHVQLLTTALGSAAPQPCQYSFPYTDPRSFVDLSMAIEGVGAAAYQGAAPLITDKSVLSTAGSILSTEQRQISWVSASVLQLQPWDGPYATALSPTGAFSLAEGFITSCPSSNPALPVTKLPSLTVSNPHANALDTLTVSYDKQGRDSGAPTYLAWINGMNVVFTNINADGTTTVPSGLAGTAYAGVVSSNAVPLTDDEMLSGLAIFQFPFNSYAEQS